MEEEGLRPNIERPAAGRLKINREHRPILYSPFRRRHSPRPRSAAGSNHAFVVLSQKRLQGKPPPHPERRARSRPRNDKRRNNEKFIAEKYLRIIHCVRNCEQIGR